MLIWDTTEIETGQLDEKLGNAFESFLETLRSGEPVVVVLDDRDIQGTRTPAQAALTHGLLGLCRTLAIEGRKDDWRISVLSITPDVPPPERLRWIERMGAPGAASGSMIRLGGGELGRTPT